MKLLPREVSEGMEKGGCYAFIREEAEEALASLMSAAISQILSNEARTCLLENYFERMELIYAQCLLSEIRTKLQAIDPVGLMLGKYQTESVTRAAEEFCSGHDGQVKTYLLSAYPLLASFREQIRKNYIDFFAAFLSAFQKEKEKIEERFFEGNRITKILHLSTSGADIHRNGRCVVGVRTDAGTVFFKPHDCGLDELFGKIVGKWFSDATVAANVIRGDGYAFVSCLRHESLRSEDEISDYYYHFGILTALFHGLGSNDMHLENIISCGTRPACADVETILGTAVRMEGVKEELLAEKRFFVDSLVRTCILPTRVYKGPVVSPLYANDASKLCLPEIRDAEADEGMTQYRTVEGHEEEFIRGFHEGYDRMLSHRSEIKEMIDSYQDATVRCLLKNTRFYAQIRLMMLRPEYLKDQASQQIMYEKFSAPFKDAEDKIDRDIIDYEWSCLKKGDIPYYCTTVAGTMLCGEEPDMVVKEDYYQVSVRECSFRFLDRLSAEEADFEERLIRNSFSHAPVDEPKEKKEDIRIADLCGAADAPVSAEQILREAEKIFTDMKDDAIRGMDAKLYWMSTAIAMDSLMVCGDMVSFGEIGRFCAALLCAEKTCEKAGLLRAGIAEKELRDLAEKICGQISQDLKGMEDHHEEFAKSNTVLPAGLYTGFGGVLLSCAKMAETGISGAEDLCRRVTDLVYDGAFYSCRKSTVAEGVAGMLLGLSFAPVSDKRDACIRACADRLLSEKLPDRADLPYGCAGIGVALAVAAKLLGEAKYAEAAGKAFEKVKAEYSDKIGGWPEGSAKIKWMADRGPHAAGIYLAASYAEEMLFEKKEAATVLFEKKEAEELLKEISDLALRAMENEESLFRKDTLDEGNAMTVLAYLRAGDKERAGSVLQAMLERKRKRGRFTVTPSGVRSAFDPSFFMGTVGIGASVLSYFDNIRMI